MESETKTLQDANALPKNRHIPKQQTQNDIFSLKKFPNTKTETLKKMNVSPLRAKRAMKSYARAPRSLFRNSEGKFPYQIRRLPNT